MSNAHATQRSTHTTIRSPIAELRRSADTGAAALGENAGAGCADTAAALALDGGGTRTTGGGSVGAVGGAALNVNANGFAPVSVARGAGTVFGEATGRSVFIIATDDVAEDATAGVVSGTAPTRNETIPEQRTSEQRQQRQTRCYNAYQRTNAEETSSSRLLDRRRT